MSSATIVNQQPQSFRWPTKDSLQTYWAGIEPYQRFLYGVGFLLLLSSVFHIGVFLVKGGPVTGPISWRKPITFGFSIGLTAVCISWLAGYLPKNRKKGWLLLGTLGVAGTIEVFLVSMQQWRGVASHFNFFAARFDAVVAVSIAIFIVPVSISIVLITVWTFRELRTSPSMSWAIRGGMTMLTVGLFFGGLMIFNAVTQFVNRTGLPPNIWGEDGVMKMPHALAIHGLQVLLVAVLLMRLTSWDEARRLFIVKLITLGYFGLIMLSTVQMLSGLAPFDLSLLPTAVSVISLAIICLGYLAILVQAWQDQRGMKVSVSSTS